MRQLMLVWGVQPILSEEFGSIGTMARAAMELAHSKGFIAAGDRVVIVAGEVSDRQGETDFLRVTAYEPSSTARLI